MKFNYRLAGLSGLVVLSACFSARAQANAGASVQSQLTSPAESAAAQLSRYAAAHDSLQRRVTSIHTQAEARLGLFQAATGTLRRKVKSYAGRKGPVVQDDGTQSALAVVKQ